MSCLRSHSNKQLALIQNPAIIKTQQLGTEHKLKTAQHNQEMTQNSPEQLRTAQSSLELHRTIQNYPKRLRTAQTSPEQPRCLVLGSGLHLNGSSVLKYVLTGCKRLS